MLPTGARVSFDGRAEASALDQQVWVLSGEVEVAVGSETHHMFVGDCLAMRVDQVTAFCSLGEDQASYFVATAGSKR